MLKWLYGTDTIQPRHSGPLTGTLHEYAQENSTGAIGLANFGYYYIPSSCNISSSSSSSSSASLPCKLHIALHGCTMSVSHISHQFILDTGYVQYADSNHMILLFPQAAAVAQEEDHNNNNNITPPPIWYPNGTEYPGAALACFDWVGWSGENANWRGGVQMEAMVEMVDVLMGGEGEGQRGRKECVDGGDVMMMMMGKSLRMMRGEEEVMMGMGTMDYM